MPIFGRKKTVDDPSTTDQTGNNGSNGSDDKADFTPQRAKARQWFQHAHAAADTYNYEYALWCFATGIKFDPEELSPHIAMYESAVQLMNKGKGPKSVSGKEIRKLSGPHPVDQFAAAEYAWMRDLRNGSAGMRLMDATVKADQREFGRWFAPKLLNILRQQKKPSKSDFLRAMRLFREVGAWEEAIKSGETAYALDPTDGDLQAELKNLAAQRAMDQGGYAETVGEEGAFRKFIKDEDRQRELEEGESISGAAGIEERNLARAQAEYEADPSVPETVNKYAQLLKKSGEPEDEQAAHDIYMKGYRETGEYRFRALAGDIRITQAERRHRQLANKLRENPDDLNLKSDVEAAHQEVLAIKSTEYNERTEKYPTDRRVKYLLGEVELERGNYEAGMTCFQAAKEDPKLRVKAAHRLGRCFAADGWHDVAIGEFKEALEKLDATERDVELDIKYDLMTSLIEYAAEHKALDHAREALEISSGIMRKNIAYRDIRKKRKEIDELVKDLND